MASRSYYQKGRPRQLKYPYGKPRRPRYGRRGYINKRTLQQELKFHDVVVGDAVVAATGGIGNSVLLIDQGIGENSRIGRKILVRSIWCRWSIDLAQAQNQTDIPSGDICRIIVYIDKQCNGANATVLDILETATFDAFRNLANAKRFRVLHDKYITINRLVSMTDGTNTSQTPLVLKHHKWGMTFKNPIAINYDGASGVITELTENNIAFMYISSEGVCGIPQQCTRIRYDG